MAALGAARDDVGPRVRVEPAGQGLEAAAREARYAVLGEVAQRFGAAVVLLGHTLDDQAETVLLGLARGLGRPVDRRACAAVSRATRRPLLDVTRAQTEAACRAEGIEWWTDPHNADPRFLRSRVRHTVLPMLEQELGPGVAAALARTADLLREDLDALDDLRREGCRRPRAVDRPAIAPCRCPVPRAPARRPRRRVPGVTSSSRSTSRALADLVSGAVRGEVQLPGHLTAYLDGDTLGFRTTAVAG